jgi:hypothetical protein
VKEEIVVDLLDDPEDDIDTRLKHTLIEMLEKENGKED